MTQDGSNPAASSPPSPQALFDGLSNASRKLAEQVMGSLSAQQRTDSAEILKSLTAGLQHDAASFAQMQQRYYQQHMELWPSLPRAAEGGPAGAPVVAPDKTDRRFSAQE